MRKLSVEKDIEFKDFVALGDGANDLGMLQKLWSWDWI